MERNKLDHMAHDYLRYGNCWEDADRLLADFSQEEGKMILSIASAGDNSFSLLTLKPKKVIAVDINPVQLYLVELKKAAFKGLNHIEFLKFLGFSESKVRLELFKKLTPYLDIEIMEYWLLHKDRLKEGVIHQAKFEKYFKTFRTRVVPLIHNKKRVKELLKSKSEEEQLRFYKERFNTWKWRALFKIFFSKFVMGRLGRDPKFLEEVKVNVGAYVLDKTGRHLQQKSATENYFLEYIFLGGFKNNLPHYARKENFEIIKSQVDNLHCFQGKVEDVSGLGIQFNAFNLSNIFEYLPEDYCKELSKHLFKLSAPGAEFVYWNLMVDRNLANYSNEFINQPVSEEEDFGFFYKKRIKNQIS